MRLGLKLGSKLLLTLLMYCGALQYTIIFTFPHSLQIKLAATGSAPVGFSVADDEEAAAAAALISLKAFSVWRSASNNYQCYRQEVYLGYSPTTQGPPVLLYVS